MHHCLILCSLAVALFSPANLYAQNERGAQTANPAPITQKARCPTSAKSPAMPVTRAVMDSQYQVGQSIIVRMNNQDERVGKLTELQTDHLVLTSSRGSKKIAYDDVASIKKWSAGWRIKKILMLPIKAPVYGAGYVSFYALLGIGYAFDWITRHR